MSGSRLDSFFDEIPAGTPPPGTKSNLIDPSTLKVPMIVLNSIMLFFMITMVSIRFYVRICIIRSVGWDDYFCIAAAVVSCVLSGLVINATQYGLGTHIWDIRASVVMNESNARWDEGPALVYPFAISLIKISILLLYFRIFNIERKLRLVIQGSIVCLTIIYTAYIAVVITQFPQCSTPIAMFTVPVCVHIHDITLIQGVVNVLTDFWVLLLPMRSLLRLQLNKRKKLGLIALFGTGLISCIMSMVRCITLAYTFANSDLTYTAAQISQYSTIEVNIAIMVASAPVLPSFFTKIKESIAVSRRVGSSTDKVSPSDISSDNGSSKKSAKMIPIDPCMEEKGSPRSDQLKKNSYVIQIDTYETTSYSSSEV